MSRQSFSTDGFFLVKDLFAPEAVAELKKTTKSIIRKYSLVDPGFAPDERVNIHGLTRPVFFTNPQARLDFFNLFLPTRLNEILIQTFGKDLYFHNSQAFFSPTNTSLQPYWHRDLQYSSISQSVQQSVLRDLLTLHVRIALEAEASLELIPGSHKRWDDELQRAVRYEQAGHHKNENLPGSVRITLAPGEIVIFHGQMLHRGIYENNKNRLALDICVGLPHQLTAGFIDGEGLPELPQLQKITEPGLFENALKVREKSQNLPR